MDLGLGLRLGSIKVFTGLRAWRKKLPPSRREVGLNNHAISEDELRGLGRRELEDVSNWIRRSVLCTRSYTDNIRRM